MDPNRFDSLTRALKGARSRRGALGSLLIGALGLLGLADTTAKKGKKKKKKKKGQDPTTQAPLSPSPPVSPPPPPAPTCSDGIKNGNETDVDCGGGTCQRCANGQTCVTANDCANACSGGTCQACTDNASCGSDARGACYCLQSFASEPNVCVSNAVPGIVDDTCPNSPCPAGTICRFFDSDESDCYTPCGAP